MRYKLAIFDLDGTILDTLDDLYAATNYALRENGFPERSKDEVRCFVGNGIRNLIIRALPEGASEETVNTTLRTFTTYYKEHCTDATKPYEGICDLLLALKQACIKTAVTSNKADFAVGLLCKWYFDSVFDAYMGEKESEGIKKKPAPDMVNMILSALETEKKDAVYIGDSDVDIATAENAGLDCIAVTWGFRSEQFLEEHGATKFARKPEDILLIMQKEEKNGQSRNSTHRDPASFQKQV